MNLEQQVNNIVAQYNEIEKEVIEATKEFAAHNEIHYDEMTESMIQNAMRELIDRMFNRE